MADLKITALAELTTPANGDFVEIVDVSDTSMAATGTNKKIKMSNLNPAETDPVFLASEAANFVTGDKANLDNQSGVNTGDEDLSGYQLLSEKDDANGYAGLDASAKIALAQLAYHNHQAGLDTVPTITEGTAGNAGKFSVATAEVWFYTDATMDDMALHAIADSGYLTPTDDTTTYVCADRDSDTWVQITSIADIDYVRYVPYFIVFKRAGSNSLHHQVIELLAHGETENHHSRVLKCARYDREAGALESISVDSSLNITGSGGGVWAVNKRYEVPAISTATRQFKCSVDDGVWTISSNTSPVINNTQYNDPANGLVSLTDTYWTVIYLYRGIEDQDHIYTTYARQEYATSALAQADNSVPSVPELISSHAIFMGRIIVKKSATTGFIIESAFETVFAASSAVTNHNSLSGRTDGNQHPNSSISIPTVGSPVNITSDLDVFDNEWSAAVMDGGDITDNGDGTVTITAGEGLLRSGASSTASLYSLAFTGVSNVSLTDQVNTYFWADYNGGVPITNHSTNATDYNCWDKCHLYTIFRDGNELHILDGRKQNIDFNRNARVKAYKTAPFAHVLGGTVIANPSLLKLTVTSGMFYYAYNQIPHDPFDTTVAGTANDNIFDYYYSNGAGGWTKVSDQKSIDNLNYDDGTGTLHALTASHYGVHWVYVALSQTPTLEVVYGTGDYALLTDAQAAGAPASLPPVLGGVGILIGKLIVQKSNATINEIDSAFDTTFSSAGVPNHNDTANKQGGATNEYYHLTSAQATVVANTSGTNTGDSSGHSALAPLASPTFTGTVTLPVGLTGVIRADTGVVSTDSDVTDLVSAASATAAGKVEIATGAEVDTGTDDVRAASPKALADQTVLLKKAGGTMSGALEAADHGTAATDQVVNVCYGTGSPPTASTTTEGTLFIQYTA